MANRERRAKVLLPPALHAVTEQRYFLGRHPGFPEMFFMGHLYPGFFIV
jgi:hypothetical protein